MKILHIGKFYPVYGGVEKVMYDLCDGLSKQGIQSDFLGVNADAKSTNIVKINEYFTVYAMSYIKKVASTYLSMSMIGQLKKIKNNYDIIHIHHPDPMACLALYLSGYKGKIICHWHSDIVKQKTILKFYKPLQTWLLKRSQFIIGTSPTYLAYSPYIQPYKNKLRLVPIGIPPVNQDSDFATIEKIRALASGRKIVYSLGRLIYYKGYQYLIDAAKYLNDDICVIIGGKGPLKVEFEQKIEQLGLRDKVFLMGRIEDEEMASYFSSCDLFCLPSTERSEAFGIVQVEAMAYGKPIVATRIEGSGVSWVNEENVSGLNVATEDPKELAEKINTILASPTLTHQLGNGALKRYEGHFTQEKMVELMLPLYKEVLNDNK
ncbi:glycosyltransferase [Rhizosphaericola mali]|uniref:Glycosyltransferase n=1 Tax=Rhizosphaericola mali TaxID=2545455 RepID=A0A5P2G186_9BACT|nr:glycosyltransferase [Rhizosphaericola mali]QES89185.1 glycosyltransferase [Rhizosphaericola mali]